MSEEDTQPMRILIVASSSPHTKEALHFGAQLSRRTSEPFTLLCVGRTRPAQGRLGKELARLRQLLEPGSAYVHSKVRFGRLAEQILREAEEEAYDLIIIGERLRPSGVLARLFGSAVCTVAERAPCPVLVVKGQVRPLRRLLLCDSGVLSPPLLDRFTARLRPLLDAQQEMTILHVMSQMSAGPGVRGEQLRADAEELMSEHSPEGQLLERNLDILEGSDLNAQPKVRHGLVVDEILEEAGSGDYDLVVIGAHPDEGWRRILLDDLAHRLLVRLKRPVLVVR
jgi:nucleotide-binding universal stress UspA family protein